MALIRHPKDFWSGVLFTGAGVFAIVYGSKYTIGTAARMGPGYFPRALGTLLIILGAVSLLRGLRQQGAPIMPWRFRPIVIVLGSTVLFGLIVQYVGLAISTVLLVVASSAGSHEFRPKESIAVAVLMAVLCVGVFVFALHIQLPVWPTFG